MKVVPFLLVLSVVFSCNPASKGEKASAGSTKTKTLPYFNSSDLTPTWEGGTHTIPPFEFLNQNGKTITNETLKGKIYVADFFFATCPGICPKLAKNMGLLQETFKKDTTIQLVSHTVMPWNDSVPVLKEYALKNNVIDTKWNLLTGEQEALYDIARKGYFADEDFLKTGSTDDFIHTENFILVDGKGYIRGLYNGTLDFDIRRLLRHIAILQNTGT